MVVTEPIPDRQRLNDLTATVEALRNKLDSMTREGGTLAKLTNENLRLLATSSSLEEKVSKLTLISTWNMSWRLLLVVGMVAMGNLGFGYMLGSNGCASSREKPAVSGN